MKPTRDYGNRFSLFALEYESFLTPDFKVVSEKIEEYRKELTRKYYFKYNRLGHIMRQQTFHTDFKVKKLIAEIVNEHYELTLNKEAVINTISINFLWRSYNTGVMVLSYRPFIFIAELQLLKEFGYVTDSEISGVIKLLESEDQENFELVFLSIQTLRNLRLKEHGCYSLANKKTYQEIINNYDTKILSLEILSKCLKL